MSNWFTNISVKFKLMLGFGLVLLLTTVLALTGWNSLENLIARSNSLERITQFNIHLNNLRVARLQYMLADGDETAAATVQARLDSFSQYKQELLDSFDLQQSLQLLREQATYIDQYRTSLGKMRQGYRTIATTPDAQQQVRDARAAIAAARQDMIEEQAQIAKRSDELYKIELGRRDVDTAQARYLQLGTALLALLFGLLAAMIIARQIIRPLQETLDAVKKIAEGDLTQDLQITRHDELGVLQQGISGMGSTLRELISGIRDSVMQIASAAEELSAITEQTLAGVNNQKLETDQVATAMHEMTATVQEVARNTEQASQAATRADGEARAGDKVVNEAIVLIERLAAEVHHSTQEMNLLQQESQKIGSVMDVIKSVAEQTNLLALNAAIEAARAGEAGRGFAVVADEVRGLAQRTQKSTEEIEELVASLQSGTQRVASAMHGSSGLTDSSVELARKAGNALANITRTVSGIQAMNQQIATAAEQQSAVADEIGRSIMNVRDVSEQTAAASEETAASSVELAHLGGQLQTMVSHFRV